MIEDLLSGLVPQGSNALDTQKLINILIIY